MNTLSCLSVETQKHRLRLDLTSFLNFVYSAWGIEILPAKSNWIDLCTKAVEKEHWRKIAKNNPNVCFFCHIWVIQYKNQIPSKVVVLEQN